MNLNGVEYYYIRNGQGDIIGLFDKTGAQVVSYTYDTWGKLVSIDGSLKDTVGVKNPYRYRGYRYDTETGLYYLQSRYYNPDWGRFINADAIAGSVGELLGHNVFAYCKNDPVNMQDSNGFMAMRNDADTCSGSGASTSANSTMSIPSDEISSIKDGAIASRQEGGAHTVKEGTKANQGKIRVWSPGESDVYIKKASYAFREMKNSVKSTFKANALINIAISGFGNYLSCGGFNKKFVIDTAFDTLSGIAIGAISVGAVTGVVALLSISAPAAGIGIVTTGIAYGITQVMKNPFDKAKNFINSIF